MYKRQQLKRSASSTQLLMDKFRKAGRAVQAANALAPQGFLSGPPIVRVQHSDQMPIPDAIVAPVAECWIARLALTACPKAALLDYVRLVAAIDSTDFSRTPHALLRWHHAEGAAADETSRGCVYQIVQLLLEHARRSSPPNATCNLEAKLCLLYTSPSPRD